MSNSKIKVLLCIPIQVKLKAIFRNTQRQLHTYNKQIITRLEQTYENRILLAGSRLVVSITCCCAVSAIARFLSSKHFSTMDFTHILSTIVLVIIFKLLLDWFKKPPNYPPGPSTIPVFGSFPFLPGKDTEKFVSDYVSSFGPVTGLKVGQYYMAMINDWKLAKSLFAKEEFSGRLQNYTICWARSQGGKSRGLVFIDGDFFSRQKNFCVKHLKNFGFGKTSLETVILEQAHNLTEFLGDNEGATEVSNNLFAVPVLNVLWSMIAGRDKIL